MFVISWFFPIGEFLYIYSETSTAISLILGGCSLFGITVLEIVTKLLKIKFKFVKVVIGGLCTLLLISAGIIALSAISTGSLFRCPNNLIASTLSEVRSSLNGATNNRCKIVCADGYSNSGDSFVFKIEVAESGETLLEGDIVRKDQTFIIYTTEDWSEFTDYPSESLDKEGKSLDTEADVDAEAVDGNLSDESNESVDANSSDEVGESVNENASDDVTETGVAVNLDDASDTVVYVSEAEPNDSLDTAMKITTSSYVSGEISESSDSDFYEFVISEAGQLTISLQSKLACTAVYLYGAESSDKLWYSDNNKLDSSIGIWKNAFSFDLSVGTYYIEISYPYYDPDNTGVGEYSFSLEFVSADCTFSGGHNDLESAQLISLNGEVKDQISITERDRYYCIEVTDNIRFTFTVVSYMKYVSWWMFPESGTDFFFSKEYERMNEALGKVENTYTAYLRPGTYYLRVTSIDKSTSVEDTGNFTLTTSAQLCEVTETDQLNGNMIYGIVAANEPSVRYSFTVSAKSKMSFTFHAEGNVQLKIINSSGDSVWGKYTYADTKKFEGITLEQGDYYLIIYNNTTGGFSYDLSYEITEVAE